MAVAEKETTLIQVRVDKNLKDEAEKLFEQMGLNPSAAVRLFYAQTINSGGIPFQPTVDPFYSKENQARLMESLEQLNTGKTVILGDAD